MSRTNQLDRFVDVSFRQHGISKGVSRIIDVVTILSRYARTMSISMGLDL